jgi:hypothetical protein
MAERRAIRLGSTVTHSMLGALHRSNKNRES